LRPSAEVPMGTNFILPSARHPWSARSERPDVAHGGQRCGCRRHEFDCVEEGLAFFLVRSS